MYKGFNTSVLKYILVIVVPEYIMKIDLVMHRPRSTFNLKKKIIISDVNRWCSENMKTLAQK